MKFHKFVFLLSGALLILLIIYIKTPYYDHAFFDTMFGAFVGTIAGAVIIIAIQTKMEQSRFFQTVLVLNQKISSSETAWEKINNNWCNVELRRAIGMSTWFNDPCGEDGQRHISLQIDLKDQKFDSIYWKGTVYNIDENFCVASRGLHDYYDWLSLIIDGFDNDLLSKMHVQMLWRSIVDSIYPTSENFKDLKGMRKWTEFMIFGDYEANRLIGKRKSYFKIRKIIEKYQPSKRYLSKKII